MAAGLITKYTGPVAEQYDRTRETSPKWTQENDWFAELLDGLPAIRTVLDVPVGTGRFLREYARRGYTAVGIDSSLDMLEQARRKSAMATLVQGDIFTMDLPGPFDLAVCVRFLNWIPLQGVESVLSRLHDCAPWLIVTITAEAVPLVTRKGKHIHSEAQVTATLAATGWAIADERREGNHRMLLLQARSLPGG